MAIRITGFGELEDELEELADDIDDAAADTSIGRVGQEPTGRRKFISIKDAITDGINEALQDHIIPRAIGRAQRWTPDGHRSEIRANGQWRGDTLYTSVTIHDDMTAYHEVGTSPHKITSNDGPLSFEWDKMGGMRVYFEQVMHPGVGGKYFVHEEVRDGKPDMERAIQRRFDELDIDDL